MAANATEINETYLTNAANAIRTKKGTSGTIKAVEFPSQISSISTGSSATGTINITTNGTHDVSSYASANVNVPSGGESRLEWTINNSIPHTVYDIEPRLGSSSSPTNDNENHLYNFYNELYLFLYPEWGYRFKESNEDYNITVSETINNEVHNIGRYSSNRTKNRVITNNSYPGINYRQYCEIGITGYLYTSPPTSGYSSTSSVSISGTAETETIPVLTTFDTTGLTKQWTGTLTYSNGTLNTDNTFPYKTYDSTTRTCTLNLKINNIYYDIYNFIEFNDTALVNKSVSGQFLACSFNPSETLYYVSNECYIQIGNIFIYYIPGANGNAVCYIPENCAMETLIEYLQANLVNEGDSIPIHKWVSGGGVTDVPVTITLRAFAKAYNGTAVTTNYNVTGWPSDTTDELIVTKIGSAVTPGTYHFDDIYSYSINYNDNPQKYNYIVTTNGSGSITSSGSPSTPTPTPGPTPDDPSTPPTPA